MKKLLMILLFCFSLNSFAKFNENDFKWYTFQEIAAHMDQIQPYDILLLNVGSQISQTWGHIFLVNKDKKLVEIKGAIEIFSDSPIYSFFNINNRNIAILRYKYIDNALVDQMEKDTPLYYNKFYSFLSNSNSEDIHTYCSKFIYTLFLDAGKKLGRNTRLFPDKYPIYPFDFLETTTLENITLKG